MSDAKIIKQYGGADVVSQQIKVTNTGDGLSNAMEVDPQDFQIGEKRYVVMETVVTKIGYEEIKDSDQLREVPTLKAGTATIVDSALVADVLAKQRKAIDEAKGLLELDLDGDSDDE